MFHLLIKECNNEGTKAMNNFRKSIFTFAVFFPLLLASYVAASSEKNAINGKFTFSKLTITADLSKLFKTECVGNENAKRFGIYLHGMGPITPTTEELNYRKRMSEVASALNMRIAIPRSKKVCTPSRVLCWPHGTFEDVSMTYEEVVDAAHDCFPEDAKFGVIGFSNGGYFAGKLVNFCLSPQPEWIIAIGSAGTVRPTQKSSLKDCAPITFLIGQSDITNKDAKAYKTALERLGARTKLSEFKGGHMVPLEPLINELKKQSF